MKRFKRIFQTRLYFLFETAVITPALLSRKRVVIPFIAVLLITSLIMLMLSGGCAFCLLVGFIITFVTAFYSGVKGVNAVFLIICGFLLFSTLFHNGVSLPSTLFQGHILGVFPAFIFRKSALR